MISAVKRLSTTVIKPFHPNMPLPSCTGAYSVGCIDIMTPTPTPLPTDFHPNTLCNTQLGTLMRLYYPTPTPPTTAKATWLPNPHQHVYAYGFAKYAKLKFFGWMLQKWIGDYRMEAHRNAPIIDQSSWQQMQECPSLQGEGKLPLVVFSHGMSGQRAVYSVFCTQLASQGFLVAAVEHREGSASTSFIQDSDGGVIEVPMGVSLWATTPPEEAKQLMQLRTLQLKKRTSDVSDVLDLIAKLDSAPEDVQNCIDNGSFDISSLKDRIETTFPLVMGHSFGGSAALTSLKNEPRLKGAICLDPWFEPLPDDFFAPSTETRKPSLLVFTEYFNFRKNMKKCYPHIEREKDFCEMVTLKKARHYDQCDIPAIIPSFLANFFAGRKKEVIPFEEGIRVQRSLITDFLRKLFERKESLSEPLCLLGEDYTLDDNFMNTIRPAGDSVGVTHMVKSSQ